MVMVLAINKKEESQLYVVEEEVHARLLNLFKSHPNAIFTLL
jgi:hypothetical protein